MGRKRIFTGEVVRFDISMDSEQLKAIDDWRYAHRVPSRAEAIRRLVAIGLRDEWGNLEEWR